ncbi:MAG: ATP-binding protein [Puniceicoccaceae bacterium]
MRAHLLSVFLVAAVASLLEASMERFFHYGEPLVQDLGIDGSKEGGYIWNIVWDDLGVAYLGRDTLWRWDGTNMRQLGPDHLVELKGMCFDAQGRLWLGSFNEIGVFDPRTLRYDSRLDWIPREKQAFGQVWDLHHDGEFLWVATDHQLFRVGEDSFSDWSFPGDHRVIFHFLESGTYAHQVGVGLWRLQDSEMHLLCDDSQLAERSVLYLEDQPDGTLMAVSGSGVFYYHENYIPSLIKNQFPSHISLSGVCEISRDHWLLGTLSDGIFELTKEGQEFSLRKSKSQREQISIIKLLTDPHGELWLVDLDSVQIVDFSFLITLLKGPEDFPSGTIRDISLIKSSLVLGMDTGVFEFKSKDLKNNWIQHTENESKKTVAFDGAIYFDDYDRLMVLKDGNPEVLAEFDREIRTFTLTSPDRLVVAFNDRLEAYRIIPGRELELLGEYSTLNGLVKLEADATGRVWGWSHRTPLLEVVADGMELKVHRYDTVSGRDLFSEEHQFAITSVGPVLVFHDTLARYAAGKGIWEVTPFDPGLGRLQAVDFRMEANNLSGWLIVRDPMTDNSLLLEVNWPADGVVDWSILPWPAMDEIGPVMDFEYVDGPEPYFVFGGLRGILIAPVAVSERIPAPGKPVIWEGLAGIQPAGDRETEFGAGNLHYSFSTPRASWHYPVWYQTRIKGMDPDWTPPSPFAFRDTGQLLDGTFDFQVRAVDPFGRVGPIASVRLKVNPPWSRTGWAYLIYFGCILLLVAFGVRFAIHLERNKQRKLERLVDERTHELRQANAFKDLLIANLSHEIRNPLNGVIGLIRQLKEDALPPLSHLKALRQAADYLRNTVEGVLDFSKIQSGQVELKFKPVNLRPVLMGPVGIYRSQAKAKGLDLKVDFEVADELVVVTDEQKIQQIMGNLVSNAIKFTEAGTVSVEVRLEVEELERGNLTICVMDTGRGIAPEDHDKIFQEFYQSKGPALKTPGTGLGLALVRQYAELLQGTVSLESTLGEGSSFTVSLPVSVAAFGSDNGEADLPGAALNLSVLVIEDTDYNRLFMEDLLVERGCRVDLAEDGNTGLQMALKGQYDLIFLDWELPGMNGVEITRELRANQQFDQSTLLVGLTAFATEDRRRAGLEAGMSAFLVKPLELRDLYRVLETRYPGLKDVIKGALESEDTQTGAGNSGESLIAGRGLLAEMSAHKDWDDLKNRWLGIFNEHVLEVAQAIEGGDSETIRRYTHKLLGHLRMLQAEPIAEPIQQMLVAAHGGDMERICRHWATFNGRLEAFREAYRKL